MEEAGDLCQQPQQYQLLWWVHQMCRYIAGGILGPPAQSPQGASSPPPPPPGPPGLPVTGGYTTPRRPTGGNPNPDGSPESDPGPMTKEDGQVLKFPKDLNRHRQHLVPRLRILKSLQVIAMLDLNSEDS
eukprot:5820553-Amphidinium_carterae.1